MAHPLRCFVFWRIPNWNRESPNRDEVWTVDKKERRQRLHWGMVSLHLVHQFLLSITFVQSFMILEPLLSPTSKANTQNYIIRWTSTKTYGNFKLTLCFFYVFYWCCLFALCCCWLCEECFWSPYGHAYHNSLLVLHLFLSSGVVYPTLCFLYLHIHFTLIIRHHIFVP